MKLKELKNGRLAAGMKHVSDVSGKLSGLDIEKPMVPPIESALESALFIVAFRYVWLPEGNTTGHSHQLSVTPILPW